LSAVPSQPGARGRRVVVVGAGVAGLTAAHLLQDAGCAVSVIEASSSIGGALQQAELGGARYEPALVTLPEPAPSLRWLLGELGLSGQVRLDALERLALLRRGRLARLDLRRLARFGVGPGIPPWEGLRLRRLQTLRTRLGPKLDARKSREPSALDAKAPLDAQAPLDAEAMREAGTPDPAAELAKRLDDRSVADFAALYLGPRVHARLLRPLLEVHFAIESHLASRALLMQLVDRRGVPALALASGVGALPARLAAALPDVRTGVRVERVRSDGRGVEVAGGARLEAEGTVLAVPAQAVPHLVPELAPFDDLFFSRHSGVSQLVLAAATRDPFELPEPVIWLAPESGGHLAALARAPGPPSEPRAARPLLLIGRPGLARLHESGGERAVREALLRGAESVLRGLRGAIDASRLHAIPLATPAFEVGGYRAAARLLEEQQARAASRPLVYCGDYLVAPHLEGAVAAGIRAARALLRAFAQ
jgi:oxygen-dependent protoporphyrinogen oxidase